MLEELESLTRSQFSLPKEAPFFFTPIFKGGSGRNFYRFQLPSKQSLILMHYSGEREENFLYSEIGKFLEELGVPVPHIEAHDSQNRVVWMEDLGNKDIYSHKEASWKVRNSIYQKTLVAAKRLHDQGWPLALRKNLTLMPGFDARLYQWERDYFFENFIERVCGLHLSVSERKALEKEMQGLTNDLLKERICLVHRDFQSQNVILKKNEVYFIDFQGTRTGTFFYDLASLLYDPYVFFKQSERIELLDFYFKLEPKTDLAWELFQKRWHAAALQRLMQALGAYGFLGLVKGKTEFLHSIPAALSNLKVVTDQLEGLPQFKRLLNKVIDKMKTEGQEVCEKEE